MAVASQSIEIERSLVERAVQRELQGVRGTVARDALRIEAGRVEACGDAGAQARCDLAVEAGDEAAERVGEAVGDGIAGDGAERTRAAAPRAPQRLDIASLLAVV